jgi:hypothetical protein
MQPTIGESLYRRTTVEAGRFMVGESGVEKVLTGGEPSITRR